MAASCIAFPSQSGSFTKLFDLWIAECRRLLLELNSAADSPDLPETELRSLTSRFLLHCQHHHDAKSELARRHVFAALSPPWLSPLEKALLWIGGWRPATAFRLVLSKLGDLSPSQLARVDAFKRETLKEESVIAEAMAAHQETVADSVIVRLSHAAAELPQGDGGLMDRVDSAAARKAEGFRTILLWADDLRLRTLRGVVDVLSPIQAVHFLAAAVGLYISIHDWANKGDVRGLLGGREVGLTAHDEAH